MQEIHLWAGRAKPEEEVREDGFLGEVPVSQFINGDALTSRIGLTAGWPQHTDEPWLKFNLDGNTLYVAKRPYRYNLSWDSIHARGAVYGTRTVQIQGDTYKVRLLKGANTDPTPGGNGYDLENTWGSEWNRLLYPLIPNPTNKPASGISGEGITFGEWAEYTEAELNVGSSGGNGRYNWCQESRGANRVFRGTSGVSSSNLGASSIMNTNYGWRPVLELIP